MKIFFVILSILGMCLSSADIIGDERLRTIEEQIRHRLHRTRQFSPRLLRRVVTETQPVPESIWPNLGVKVILWGGLGLGFFSPILLIAFVFSPPGSIFLDHGFFQSLVRIYSFVAVIAVAGLLLSFGLVLLDSMLVLVGGFFQGMLTFVLGIVMVLTWLAMRLYSFVDSFVQEKKLKSTIYLIGLCLSSITLIWAVFME